MYAALSANDAIEVWPHVAPLLEMAVSRDRGRSSMDVLRNDVGAGNCTVWINDDLSLAWVTSIEVYPTGKKVCLVRYCGGQGLDICQQAIETIAEYARVVGCDHLEIVGREGWLRALPGFERDYTVMTRPLWAEKAPQKHRQ
jgi:hypothetical protein